MTEQIPQTAAVDHVKAEKPPTAADVYLIASRLKRLITASFSATIANASGDQEDYKKQLEQFRSIARSLEPLLHNLVFEGELPDE